MVIEENIRNIREFKNLSQEYVADRLGLTQAGYSKIENGTTVLTFTRLKDIAEILNVTINSIIIFNELDFTTVLESNENESQCALINKLYEEKANLYKLLLDKTQIELDRYVNKYGVLI